MSSIERIVFRGDQEAYARRSKTFPYIDLAADAGATGVHIWFWGESFRSLKDAFFAYFDNVTFAKTAELWHN